MPDELAPVRGLFEDVASALLGYGELGELLCERLEELWSCEEEIEVLWPQIERYYVYWDGVTAPFPVSSSSSSSSTDDRGELRRR